MQRLLLFVFLVVAVPGVMYWWSHGFENPGTNVRRFTKEVGAFSGGRPPPEPTTPQPEPEPEPEPEPKPEPKPELEPKPEPKPEPPTENPEARAKRLFAAGTFDDAAAAYAGIDEAKRSLALFGLAFQTAFPKGLPPGDYMVVTTATGAEFSGFAEERAASVKLTEASGKSMSFPNSALRGKQRIPRAKAIERIARDVAKEGAAPTLTGSRVFALIVTACRAGRTDVAAPLLQRVLDIDEKKPFFLSSVKNRVDAALQSDMYRAFATAQAPRIVAVETVVKSPNRLGNGIGGIDRSNRGGTERGSSGVKDPKARALMTQARPFRKKAEAHYRKAVLAGFEPSSKRDVFAAVENFDKAIALYEKAVMIEDSDAIYAILRRCSKLNFQLRFHKQNLGD